MRLEEKNGQFDLQSTAKVKVDTVPSEAEDSCREAADACPVDAIAITE